MKIGAYNEILDFVQSMKGRIRVANVINEFPGISKYTIGSIVSQEYQKKMKKVSYKHHDVDFVENRYHIYWTRINRGEDQVLVSLANEVEISPSLLARTIVEKHVSVTEYDGKNVPKPVLAQMMKDTSLIKDPVLAREVDICILDDDFYGPIVDSIRHSIGHEYEFLLKKKVDEKGLSYLDEDQMRARGYDKTPDVKLEVPISIDGHVVNWIESKASFGDEVSHRGYLKDQFWSYWNRFGPGLVIYWFGFIDELDTNRDKGILLKDHFPEDIVKMNPLCLSNR
ncbi:CDAN1-interacting nuclease 1-like [Lineus longissimus]|uniref:CDAN1-interacting nuclease 1-like n=1 Tax=Lineus longissimus TaxID=88925 RepID=UPI002B4C8824